MKRRKAHEEYDKAVNQLVDMPAIMTLKAQRKSEGMPFLPPEGPDEAIAAIVDCPICRHKFGFITERQANLKLADIRRALISYVSRALHKFMN